MIIGSGAASCADSSCTGFTTCQNAEGAGYDNSETWTEDHQTVDEDNTSDPGRGSQDISITYNSGTARVFHSFTGVSERKGHFLFKISDATPASIQDIYITDDGSTTQLRIRIYTDGSIGISDGTSTSYTTDVMSDATWYHIWWHYIKGSGSDAFLSAEFTAKTTYAPVGSGNKYVEITNGVSNQDISREQFLESHGSTIQLDQILGKNTTIGTVCP